AHAVGALASAGRLHLVRPSAAGQVGLALGVLHGDLRPDPAPTALVPAPERDPGRRAHGPLPHGLRDVLDGGEQPALPRPLSPPRTALERPRRHLHTTGVDDTHR